jgi:hypothetical protein
MLNLYCFQGLTGTYLSFIFVVGIIAKKFSKEEGVFLDDKGCL